jgi:acid phosphatase class B
MQGYQSLIDSMVIRVKFGIEDHVLISHNCDWKGSESLDVKTDYQTRLN